VALLRQLYGITLHDFEYQNISFRSAQGDIYSIGGGSSEPPSNDKNSSKQLFQKIEFPLVGIRVSKVCCGWSHSVAVDGERSLNTLLFDSTKKREKDGCGAAMNMDS
jgi:hypothetical protein